MENLSGFTVGVGRCREWGMGNGEWGMGNGEWGMGNGEWGIGNRESGIGNRESGIAKALGLPAASPRRRAVL
ncbi:hypothetical protein E1J22_13985 [Xanthomonas citri]|nr:hypothetical protein [Xanthomonas citri]